MGEALFELQQMHQVELKLATIRRAREGRVRQVEMWARKIRQTEEKSAAQQRSVRETQMRLDALSLDIASRTEAINKHRVALTKSKTNKEYAAILTAMNTEKADTSKIEVDALQLMEQVQTLRDQLKKIEEEKAELLRGNKIAEDGLAAYDVQTSGELRALQAQRDQVAQSLTPQSMMLFSRAAQRHDGEAMAKVERVHPKKEDFVCQGCNMKVTLEVVNALHTRNELQVCGACGRILYLHDSKANPARV